MKRIAITLNFLLAVLIPASLSAHTIRDPQSPASLRDSLVLVDAQGSRTVSYPRTQISTEVSKIKKSGVHQKDRILNDQQLDTELERRQSQTRSVARTVSRDLTGYSVGSIPIEASVSASGARIYNVPLNVLPGGQLTPKLALSYNSQGFTLKTLF